MTTFQLANLRCEYRVNPLGIDVARPRLAWQMRTTRRNARQVAYRLVAAYTPEALDGGSVLWDTGRVASDQSTQVAYDGPPLESARRIYWRVTVWDDAGSEVTSAPAWWEMGLLARDDWQAQWIAAPLAGGAHTSSPAPYLRNAFRLRGNIETARLYITSVGLYEAWLNGQRVGDALLTPGWTDYARRIQYQVYDVAELLRDGENAMGVILGDGWAVGHVAWAERQRYADRPRLLAQLVVRYTDGTSDTIASDGSWKVSTGGLLESDMLMGESFDARREPAGWNAPGFADQRWWPVEVVADTGAALVATNGPTVRRQDELAATILGDRREHQNTRWVFDLGQNMVGWVRLRLRGQAGRTIRLRYAEVLNPDRSLYLANLRSARNVDYYTAAGDDEEVWEPRFTFHGFRYVEVFGLAGPPTPDMVTGVVIHSDTPTTGMFTTSDALINQLQHNIEWGQKGNFVDVPTDCPQRDERLGWTGDAQVFVRTAAFNKDVAGFFTKWAQDVEDAQSPTGAYPAVAPNPGVSNADGGPAWADAGVICPWTMYLCYGDKRILERFYPSMQRYVDFLHDSSRDGIRNYADYAGWHGYGDWLALDGSSTNFGGTSKELIGSAFYAYSTRLVGKIAAVLGKHDDAERYEARFRDARLAFQKRFVTAGGLLAAQTQTAYVLALHFDLLPDALRPVAAAEIVRDIRARGNHLSTGFVGTPYLAFVLTEAGYLEVAYELLRQQTWPSWLYSVTQGATTIWERWDGWTDERGFQDPGMNSFNHYAYGAIGAWMYAVMAGLDTSQDQPGFKHAVLRPRPGGGFHEARAALETPYGTLSSAWTLAGDTFTWDVTVPPNTTATAYVPVSLALDVREGDLPANTAEGVTATGTAGGAAIYELGSGAYHFTSRI